MIRNRHSAGEAIAGLTFAVVLSLFLGCGAASLPAARKANGAVSEATRIVILTEAQVRAAWIHLARCDRADTIDLAPAWTPTPGVVAASDSLVRAELRADSRLMPGEEAEYLVQYLGVFSEGQRALLANGILPRVGTGVGYDPLREVVDRDAHTTPIVMCDGGILRFTMVLDTAGGLIRPLRFNPTVHGREEQRGVPGVRR